MIVSVTGAVTTVNPPTLVLDCNGIGYEVWMPLSCFGQLPPPGESLRVHTALVVREDSHTLYGFLEARERDLFNVLLGVNGVGAKTALGLLSTMDTALLAAAIERNDTKALTRAPGIGRKGAERIIMELRGHKFLHDVPATTPILSQASEGLVGLGFPAAQVRAALARVQAEGMDVSSLIKAGLAELAGTKTK